MTIATSKTRFSSDLVLTKNRECSISKNEKSLKRKNVKYKIHNIKVTKRILKKTKLKGLFNIGVNIFAKTSVLMAIN